jgi:hypothetical protein
MPVENFTREAAHAQAEAISAYWARRGYKVNVSVVPITGANKRAGTKTDLSGFHVETDMINGLPRELYRRKVNAEKAK